MAEPRTISPMPPEAPARLALRSLLKNECRGEGRARPKARLLEDLAARGHQVDRRVLDETLRAMRAAGYPVAATEAGIFWAVRREELAKARHYVVARFQDLRETAAAYDRLLAAWGRTQLPDGPPQDGRGQGLLFRALAPGSRT